MKHPFVELFIINVYFLIDYSRPYQTSGRNRTWWRSSREEKQTRQARRVREEIHSVKVFCADGRFGRGHRTFVQAQNAGDETNLRSSSQFHSSKFWKIWILKPTFRTLCWYIKPFNTKEKKNMIVGTIN